MAMEHGQLRNVFGVLEGLVSEGVATSYALVGAVAAIFYVEAIRTFDLDVAVTLPPEPGPLVSLAPLYAHLRELGFHPEREHVRIHGVPVQFLSSDPPLWSDAVAHALRFDYEGESVRVAPPEHLILMALEAPSPRRRERAAHLLEAGSVNLERLRDLSARFGISLPESFGV